MFKAIFKIWRLCSTFIELFLTNNLNIFGNEKRSNRGILKRKERKMGDAREKLELRLDMQFEGTVIEKRRY